TDDLGIDPGPDLQAVHLEVLRGRVEAVAGGNGHPGHPGNPGHPGRVRTNLRAQLTSFVGREDDVARVGRALDDYRLVTLVGPGGAGKTRLASEVAAHIAAEVAGGHQADGAADGVWLAELASVTDAAD